ncbi:polygalacturonase 1 beta-like protein 3 [Arachis stenosperma]|uniref:polygalacturonase 1 beta-like protein 3 n=1 Tax=Arachis stenosperma TaxID=217475 RepID=UPI0025AB67C5|nr:polygalacturonase 1 beta-like protein 3 [Arachis stenosperma]XP_057762833.1 polygalacturonase 1 beta-like protein 3 [Arachis stenosperma]XP_057762834.1 polygalacturonase 1 beta-like protein 3 [Arachis stenosperma]
MNKQLNFRWLFILILFLSTSPFLLSVSSDANGGGGATNPFTPKASLLRYWDKEIRNNVPKPNFLLSKASPLTAVDAAAFSKLAGSGGGIALSTRLPEFCAAANLLCFPDLGASLEKHDKDANFAGYGDKNFTNYGTSRPGGSDAFKKYSDDANIPVNDFRRYGRDSAGHSESFSSYATDGNVVDQSFHTYGSSAAGGGGDFRGYASGVNVPNLGFTSYSDHATGRTQSFNSYSENGNAGQQSFTSYGKNGNKPENTFTGYGTESNVVGSGFSNYAETANAGNDTFKGYGVNMNNPTNTFSNYASGGNGAVESFTTYREQSNVGADSFTSYAKGTNAAKVEFSNYGKSFNEGTDTFSGYGKGSTGKTEVGFTGYGVNNTFKDYTKDGMSFARYTNVSSGSGLDSSLVKTKDSGISGSLVNKWVEPGKFFREKMIKEGTVMPIPDIRDKMPKRSFLPRTILSKLPFSTSKIPELKQIFKASDNGSMEKMMRESLQECERVPSPGETKRCVGSMEDMIDFATSVLGRNIAVRSTLNVNGSKKNVLVGKVIGINGGRVTQSVSCHQSLFPYLLYYCHSVPKVRVYEADLLDPKSKDKVNHGVAICHLDTSAWSPTHGAFLSLGSGPGRIEVCHWIFENDMTWTIAD